ncbi:MAG TPA: tRNA (adenosine(37)-N6)-threonylcarbamoyltransferase complex dimerization subunit type 1 TsaB [Thermomicrobiales bacterium]|nr:tRNA (adenosine(37)-N6)-threonylcarbamoyltransferase complex dimerization subunit type 1 TsaB [Thermomicrobiales bacterium]
MNTDFTFAEASNRWMLAIDTSTEQAGLALGDGERLIARSWDAGRTQTTSILPVIAEMMGEADIESRDLAAVGVATGPGTFTGLRVGLSIAKGFVLAQGVPIVGVPTLEIAAASFEPGTPLVAVLSAGRGRVVWQRFGNEADSAPANTTVPELIETLASTPDALVTGELAESHRVTIEAAHPRVDWRPRDPAILLWLARDRWRRGLVDDPVTLEPTYLHGVTVTAGPVQDRLRRSGE